jgi:nitroreductase
MAGFFNLPPHIVPVSLIAIGYPMEKPDQPERFKPDRIKYGNWHDQ